MKSIHECACSGAWGRNGLCGLWLRSARVEEG